MNDRHDDTVERAMTTEAADSPPDTLAGLEFDLPFDGWKECPMNLYLWTASGVCVDEHLGAGNHPSIIGCRIEDLFELPNGREIQEGWDRAIEGEGTSFFSNAQNPPSIGGFLPLVPLPGMRPERAVGFCLPLGPRMFDSIKRFIKY